MKSAMKLVAKTPLSVGAAARFGFMLGAALLAGCAGLIDKPVQRTLYDFGPGATSATARQATLPPVVLSEIDAAGALDGFSVLYRLGYADANQLRPYAQARSSAPAHRAATGWRPHNPACRARRSHPAHRPRARPHCRRCGAGAEVVEGPLHRLVDQARAPGEQRRP